MIAISWNCRGLGARIKRSQIKKLSSQHNPSFILLQESKTELFHPKLIKSICPDDDISWLSSPSIGSSGGLLSLWKHSFFTLDEYKIERNWIALKGIIPSMNFHCAIINIYNPCSIDGRDDVWKNIIAYWEGINLPTLIMGDFNEVLSPEERGSQIISQEGVADFYNFIQEMKLMEISPSNGFFTWFHGKRRSKLDRCLVNPEWIQIFPHLSLSILNRSVSDHSPLLLQSSDANWGPKPFRFMNCWTSHPHFLPTVRKAWANSSNLPITDKLKIMRTTLKEWNKAEFGLIDENIKRLEERIHQIDTISNDRALEKAEICDRKKAQLDLWTWLKRKESYWAQNSLAKWLKEGDRNTKFFHAMASVRK